MIHKDSIVEFQHVRLDCFKEITRINSVNRIQISREIPPQEKVLNSYNHHSTIAVEIRLRFMLRQR